MSVGSIAQWCNLMIIEFQHKAIQSLYINVSTTVFYQSYDLVPMYKKHIIVMCIQYLMKCLTSWQHLPVERPTRHWLSEVVSWFEPQLEYLLNSHLLSLKISLFKFMFTLLQIRTQNTTSTHPRYGCLIKSVLWYHMYDWNLE